MQIFTKAPQRWAERVLDDDEVAEFRRCRAEAKIPIVASHDSYLINLATPDAQLLERSTRAFQGELERCERLGIDFLVTHPGNATSGAREAALSQNVARIADALRRRPGSVRVLIETTAGSGTALGARFEELAAMLEAAPSGVQERLGICMDTAHLYAAGYDLRGDYDGVMRTLDEVVGLDRLHLIHCNDSRGKLGSRLDRHAGIGDGELGEEPFGQLMKDPRLGAVARIIETPKGDDPTAADRRNLEVLRRLAVE